MRNFQSKRKLRGLLYSRAMFLVLIIMVILLGKSVWSLYLKSSLASTNRDRAAAELAALEERSGDLQTKIEKLKTDRGVEEEIRRNLSVVKEGERVITVVDEPEATTTAKRSWWREWFSFGD